MKYSLVLLLSLLTSACVTLTDDLKRVAVNHTIMGSPEGELVSPDDYNKKLSTEFGYTIVAKKGSTMVTKQQN